jgi:endoglucanase
MNDPYIHILCILWLTVSLIGCAGPGQQTTAVPTTAPTTPPPSTHTSQPTTTPTSLPPTATPTPLPTLTPPPDTPDRFAQATRLGRGINLANALQAPYEGAWGIVLQEKVFAAVREAGSDSVYDRFRDQWNEKLLRALIPEEE